jgi:signal transduction histidine kinase
VTRAVPPEPPPDEALRFLADEQAALRRVATLIAGEAEPADVFEAVAREVAHVLRVPLTSLVRCERGVATQVGVWGDQNPFPVGTSWPIDEYGVSGRVARTGRPARVDYEEVPGGIAATLARTAGIRVAVGVPIVVNGEVWGAMMALSAEHAPLPDDTEVRLGRFTELVATAIANAHGRDELRRLAQEQAALRRVATLVAGGAAADVVFDAVCEETGRLIGASNVHLAHYTSDGINVTMAGWSLRANHLPAGTRFPLDGETVDLMVKRTGAPARVETYEGVEGDLAATLRALGIRSEVAAPVVIDGQVWGGLIAGSDQAERFPAHTEMRVASFAELIATAVSNATARSELIASRARIVTAADAARQRLARDLHDGAQQRLVAAVMSLQLAGERLDGEAAAARQLVEEALEHTREGLSELRELAAGMHPSILTNRGLRAAANALARRGSLPVEVDIPDGRWPPHIEAAAYFFIAEALTNAAKYAEASNAVVRVGEADGRLDIEVSDDGIGGADVTRGTGLLGLRDRVEALGGHLHVDSPPGGGTRLHATLALADPL